MKKITIQHRLEYLFALCLAALFRLLPIGVSLAIGMGVGWFAYSVLSIRRKVMLANLAQAFPQKPVKERNRIARRCFMHYGGMAAEFALLPKLNRKYLEKYIEIRGREFVDRVLQEGKGGFVISGHFGNWEIMGGGSATLGYPVTYVATSQSNPLVDKMMDDYRKALGIEIWKRREAVKGVLKSLRNNRFVAILIDQDARRDCVFVDFFGKQAATHRGAAVFHLKTGAPLIFSYCTRIKGPYYRITFEEVPLNLSGGSKDEQIREITQTLTTMLEDKIREHPEQWFWMHKRWKTQPERNKS